MGKRLCSADWWYLVKWLLLVVFLSGCTWLQGEAKIDTQLTSECIVRAPDGTVMECRVGGSKSESATHDEKKAK